ncbi:unnamed protein product [Gulo gulo]|uniref:Uncharacterized protein n=1 Tax=Gulo gulo TaxID=48420 RepID=A0A9X9LCA3_GULGU|nr:unnamed protein product [Gulo gulo]
MVPKHFPENLTGGKLLKLKLLHDTGKGVIVLGSSSC